MFSVTARYAVRALVELALLPGDGAILGRELSLRTEIPPNYLSKILWLLGGNGLVEASRGVRGGYRLRRRPEDIVLTEVIDLFDRPEKGRGCFLNESRACSDARPCSAHGAWKKVAEVRTQFLTGTTLADIAGNPVTSSKRRRKSSRSKTRRQ